MFKKGGDLGLEYWNVGGAGGQKSWKRLLQTAEEDTAVRGKVVRGG